MKCNLKQGVKMEYKNDKKMVEWMGNEIYETIKSAGYKEEFLNDIKGGTSEKHKQAINLCLDKLKIRYAILPDVEVVIVNQTNALADDVIVYLKERLEKNNWSF